MAAFCRLLQPLPVLLAVVMAAPAIAQAQQTDEAIRRLVVERLRSEDITDVLVSVDRGVVFLRGTVRTLAVKEKAIKEASDTAVVISELVIPRAESDGRLAEEVADRLRRYVFFTIFDDAEVEVDEGVVTLKGHVTMPYKAEAFADLAARVAGVQAIENKIRTLPTSLYDEQLRYAIARRIYGDPLFSPYAIQINPPVHIIVEHGKVTLTGTVPSEVERRTAEAIARSTLAFSVTNKLRVEIDE
jgi:hyperosmotically inducible protein